jgi:hypothetical protein
MIESTVIAKRWAAARPSPDDFERGPPREIGALPWNTTPYCFDFEKRRLIGVVAPDVFDHPVLHQAQRMHAQRIVQIPYEELVDESPTPTLIFSPGRCGSTLFVRALQVCGLPSASEPYYFRQIAVAPRADLKDRLDHQDLLRKATSLLSRQLGTSTAVIKLHGHCNFAPLLISQAFPSARIIFITRNPVDWAISMKRIAPKITPGRAMSYYRSAQEALELLSRAHGVLVCRYEDFAKQNVGYFRMLASRLGAEGLGSEDALRDVLARDSQVGSGLGKHGLADRPADDRYVEEFKRLWGSESEAFSTMGKLWSRP